MDSSTPKTSPDGLDSELNELIRMTHWTAAECRLEDINFCVDRRDQILNRLQAMRSEGMGIAPEIRRLLKVLDGATDELMLSLHRCYRERFTWLETRQTDVAKDMPLLNQLLGSSDPVSDQAP